MFHVRDPHALIQAAGYLKYVQSNAGESIYFRGQTTLYGSLVPSLFRGCRTQRGQSPRVAALRQVLADVQAKCSIFSQFDTLGHEPLLQHYGYRTSWIDVVDNIWVALWFACHTAKSFGPTGEFVHFEQRSTRSEPNGNAYVLLVATDAPSWNHARGVHVGSKTELVDLRSACPSIFVRPHAQHGLLFRLRGTAQRPVDYGGQVYGVIRVSLADALSWLGGGQMLGTHSLFPPAYYDHGYQILLKAGLGGSKTIGAIQHVGA